MPPKCPCAAPTFDDRQAAPLDLLPAAAHQPGVDLLQQLCQVVRVRLHDLVELSELQRGDMGNIGVWASQRFPELGGVLTFPGRKNTLVNPNLKSLSFSPRALNSAYRGSNTVNNKKKKLHGSRTVQRALLLHLAEESRVETRQLVRHVLLVHVVELMEGSSGGEAPLHQIQHRHHA